MERQWLIKIRKSLALSQEQVSMLTGIPRQTYSLYECGLRNPSPKNAKILGKELGFCWTIFFE